MFIYQRVKPQTLNWDLNYEFWGYPMLRHPNQSSGPGETGNPACIGMCFPEKSHYNQTIDVNHQQLSQSLLVESTTQRSINKTRLAATQTVGPTNFNVPEVLNKVGCNFGHKWRPLKPQIRKAMKSWAFNGWDLWLCKDQYVHGHVPLQIVSCLGSRFSKNLSPYMNYHPMEPMAYPLVI